MKLEKEIDIIGYLTKNATDKFGRVLLTKGMPLNVLLKEKLEGLHIPYEYTPVEKKKSAVLLPPKLSAKKLFKNQKNIFKVPDTLDPKFDSLKSEIVSAASDYLQNTLSTIRKDNFFSNSLKTLSSNNMTLSHSINVAILSLSFGSLLNYDQQQLQDLSIAALFHDIGAILLPPEILKSVSRIDDQQELLYRQHPRLGSDLLKGDKLPKEIYIPILQHHEKFDGRGYPAGLKENEITKNASIINICDTFDYLTTSIYQSNVRPPKEAVERIKFSSGKDFNPQIVDTFINLFK